MGEYDLIEYDPYTIEPSMGECSECGGTLRLRIWGEGIDSEIWCTECEAEDIYR